MAQLTGNLSQLPVVADYSGTERLAAPWHDLIEIAVFETMRCCVIEVNCQSYNGNEPMYLVTEHLFEEGVPASSPLDTLGNLKHASSRRFYEFDSSQNAMRFAAMLVLHRYSVECENVGGEIGL